MTRTPFLTWCCQVLTILERESDPCTDWELMFAANLTPVEAAAEIAVAEFTRSLNFDQAEALGLDGTGRDQ
jgi:hypothetical protein